MKGDTVFTPYPVYLIPQKTLRERWFWIQIIAVFCTVAAFLVYRKAVHPPAGHALALLLMEGGPGVLILAWWGVRLCGATRRAILWLLRRTVRAWT